MSYSDLNKEFRRLCGAEGQTTLLKIFLHLETDTRQVKLNIFSRVCYEIFNSVIVDLTDSVINDEIRSSSDPQLVKDAFFQLLNINRMTTTRDIDEIDDMFIDAGITISAHDVIADIRSTVVDRFIELFRSSLSFIETSKNDIPSTVSDKVFELARSTVMWVFDRDNFELNDRACDLWIALPYDLRKMIVSASNRYVNNAKSMTVEGVENNIENIRNVLYILSGYRNSTDTEKSINDRKSEYIERSMDRLLLIIAEYEMKVSDRLWTDRSKISSNCTSMSITLSGLMCRTMI